MSRFEWKSGSSPNISARERTYDSAARADADASAQAEAKWRQHFGQRASAGAEHHPEAQHDDAHPGGGRGCGGLFPLASDLGEESRPGGAVLAENFVSAIAIEPDGAGANQDAGFVRGAGDSFGHRARALNSRFENGGLLRRRPTTGGDVAACEVDDGV